MKRYAQYISLCIFLCVFSALAMTQEQMSKEQYGRLFHDAHQRQLLENQRGTANTTKIIGRKGVLSEKPATPPITEPVTLNGYVKRSDGKSTVWVNGQPVQENTTLDAVQVGKLTSHTQMQKGRKQAIQSDKLNINLPANGQRVQLKAGQQYDPQSHQIKEVTTLAKEKQLLLESADEATGLE